MFSEVDARASSLLFTKLTAMLGRIATGQIPGQLLLVDGRKGRQRRRSVSHYSSHPPISNADLPSPRRPLARSMLTIFLPRFILAIPSTIRSYYNSYAKAKKKGLVSISKSGAVTLRVGTKKNQAVRDSIRLVRSLYCSLDRASRLTLHARCRSPRRPTTTEDSSSSTSLTSPLASVHGVHCGAQGGAGLVYYNFHPSEPPSTRQNSQKWLRPSLRRAIWFPSQEPPLTPSPHSDSPTTVKSTSSKACTTSTKTPCPLTPVPAARWAPRASAASS